MKRPLINRLVTMIAVIEPITTLPQAIQIFRHQNASGVSIFSWAFFQLFTFVWLWYGVANRDRAIVIYSVLFFLIQTAVIVGAVMYGGSWW